MKLLLDAFDYYYFKLSILDSVHVTDRDRKISLEHYNTDQAAKFAAMENQGNDCPHMDTLIIWFDDLFVELWPVAPELRLSGGSNLLTSFLNHLSIVALVVM